MPLAKPHGYTDVMPWIITRDTSGLLDFLSSAFDAAEIARILRQDGSVGCGGANWGQHRIGVRRSPRLADDASFPAPLC